MKAIKLIEIYYRICQIYNEYLWQNVQRFSPNGNQGEITDQELSANLPFLPDGRAENGKKSHASIY